MTRTVRYKDFDNKNQLKRFVKKETPMRSLKLIRIRRLKSKVNPKYKGYDYLAYFKD